MATDSSWLYSTIAQSSATIVAIIGGFITATVLNLLSEKRNLKNQREDKETRIKTLRQTREDLTKELEPKEVLSFIESITNDVINSDNLPSFEEIKGNYQYTQNLNLEILKKDYETFTGQVIKARSFIKKYSDKIIAKEASTFDEWVKMYQVEISSYNYELLEKEYNKVIAKKRESLSSLEQVLMPPNLLTMSLPYMQPISEQQELKSLSDKIRESKYEITSLENDVASLNARLTAFNYPPYLRLGASILVIFAIFSIVLPISLIRDEVFSLFMKQITYGFFIAGLIAVILYITLLITELRRK